MRFKLLIIALLLSLISQTALAQLEPFTDYDTPCFVLYGGELAVYVPSLSDEPMVIKEK